MMTACEPQDRETLHQFAMSFTDRLANCRQLLESHDLLLPPSIVSISIKPSPPQLFSSMSIRASTSTSTSAPNPHNFLHPSLHQSQGQGQGRDVASSSRASPGDPSMIRHFNHDPIVGPL